MSASRDVVRGRAAARKLLVQALYQWQLAEQPADDLAAQFAGTPEYARADAAYFREALAAICADRETLDAWLRPHSDIELARLDPVEHAVLYVGIWELTSRPDVPYRVVINEAVELAKRFGATEGHRFVNAVLDKASRAHRAGERGAVA